MSKSNNQRKSRRSIHATQLLALASRRFSEPTTHNGFSAGKVLRFILLAVVVGVVGCSTVGSLTPQQRADRARVVLQATSEAAVLFAYSKDTNALRYVDLTIAVLDKVLVSTNLAPSSVSTQLATVGVKELKSTEAQLALTTLEMTYDLFWSDLVRQNVDAAVYAKEVLGGLRVGLWNGRQKLH